jgi:hypothetical protein
MRKRIAAVLGIAGATLAVAAAAPAADVRAPAGPVTHVVSVEGAHAQKGRAARTGDRGADLISSIAIPILIVVIGVIALVALAKREVGLAISAMLIGLIAGWFLMAPDSVEATFKSVYSAVF